jgi:hypothetical protein
MNFRTEGNSLRPETHLLVDCRAVDRSGFEFDGDIRSLSFDRHPCRTAGAHPNGGCTGRADILVELASIERAAGNRDRFAAKIPDGIRLAAGRGDRIRDTRQRRRGEDRVGLACSVTLRKREPLIAFRWRESNLDATGHRRRDVRDGAKRHQVGTLDSCVRFGRGDGRAQSRKCRRGAAPKFRRRIVCECLVQRRRRIRYRRSGNAPRVVVLQVTRYRTGINRSIQAIP